MRHPRGDGDRAVGRCLSPADADNTAERGRVARERVTDPVPARTSYSSRLSRTQAPLRRWI
jgi:hypothetical protein